MIDVVSLLIVTHNHKNDLPRLLDSLIKYGYKDVFICDAASTDGTRALLRTSPYHLQTIYKDKLESFSKNNNDLIRRFKLTSSYYFILNPDTYFEEDILPDLLHVLQQNPRAALVSPLVKYPDGRIQKSWKQFPSPIQVLRKRLGIRTIEDEAEVSAGRIDWCLGAAMLVDANKAEQDGVIFDERYRLYCEDADLCVRCHVRGYEVIGTDKVTLYHTLGEKSSKSIFSKYNYWNIASAAKFMFKWNIRYFRLLW